MKEEWILTAVQFFDMRPCRSHAEMDARFLRNENTDPDSYNYVNGNTNWERTEIDFETVCFSCMQCAQIRTFKKYITPKLIIK